MKVYKTEEEMMKDVKDGWLIVNGNVTFEFDLNSSISINAGDIIAWNINAGDINAKDIIAGNNITAEDLKARHIAYHAFCISYKSISCTSWEARRKNSLPPQCLDGELTIRKGTK